MELTRTLLKDATEQGLISESQAEQLWDFLAYPVLEKDWKQPFKTHLHLLLPAI